MAYHDPEDNLCHYMAFRIKIFKVGKFPTSWSLTKLQDFWYPHVARNEWIDFSSQTVRLRPSERTENLTFLSSHFSFSLSSFFLPSPFLYVFLSSPPIHRIPFSICLLPSHFSHFLIFLFSFFFSFLSFLFLLLIFLN